MKRLYIILFLCLLGFTHGSFANSVLEQKLENSYNKYVSKLGRISSTKQVVTLKKLSDVVDEILETKKLTPEKRDLIEFLAKINNNAVLAAIIKKESEAFQKIYDANSSNDLFDRKITNNQDIFLEDGTWYFYRYNKWASFPNSSYDTRDIVANSFSNSTTILDIRDGKIVFIKEFKKIKLIDDSIISGVKDKYEFLKEVKDDKRFLSGDTDEYFKQLKADTKALIGDEKNTEKKIQKIYDFVLSEVNYTVDLDLEDKKIFSGILTYLNKDGVCEGYSKLMMYMLGFTGIGDYEVIRGYVLDALDFPNIGHAWVRIGDSYYDPTFDDPIGLKDTRTSDQYIYYDLPKDLFYTNRYHYDDIPEFLKERSVEFRDNYINKRLANLVDKYKTNNYILLKLFDFKQSIGLEYDQDITIAMLKDVFEYYEVVNNRLTQNGQNVYTGNKFSYYPVNDSIITTTLKQIQYSIDEYFLIKFEDATYGIGYDLN